MTEKRELWEIVAISVCFVLSIFGFFFLAGMISDYIFAENIGNWTDVSMNPNTFCIANGYNYGQPYAANGTYDNVKCFMNTSEDQGSFKTYRIWNTTRTINDTSYVYCNGEPIYTVD